MKKEQLLAQQFEDNRVHLRGVAFRMLASASDADDAVQEAWLRLSRADANGVENLRGWLTTVVARVSLDILRTRKSRSEESLEPSTVESLIDEKSASDPAFEAELADSVGVALLVVLDKLSPAERLAFVLHDTCGLPFDEIAPIVGCSAESARQLASRARRRVRGTGEFPNADIHRQREVAGAFLAASRGGDFAALLRVLDPNVVLRADTSAAPPNGIEIRGASGVVTGARNFSDRAPHSHLALINGQVGIVVAPRGRLMLVLAFTIEGEKIVAVDVIAEPARLAELDLAVLTD